MYACNARLWHFFYFTGGFMAQYDGSIRINTKIDTKDVPSQLMKLENSMQKAADKVSSLRQKMESLKDVKIPTQEYQEIQRQIEATEKKINDLVAHQEKFIATGGKESSSVYQKMQYDLDELKSSLPYLKGELQDLVDTGKAFTFGFDTEQYSKLGQELKYAENNLMALNKRHDELVTKQGTVSERFSKMKDSAKKALNVIKSLLLLIGKIGKKVFPVLANLAKKSFSSISGSAKKSSNFLSTFASRLKGLALSLLIFNWISKAFNAMISGMKQGFTNFMNYSDSFANSVQGMKNAMSTLGNQFAAAFAPIAQMVIPWLTKLVSVISTAMTYVAQFIAILGGKSTFVRAKQVQDKYNKSLGNTAKAADKARGALARFDDLDVLQKKEDAAAGGTGGADDAIGDLFEEVPIDQKMFDFFDWLKDMWENSDFYELGKMLGEKLKEALENIPWDEIKEVARKIGKSLASLINGFIEVEDLGYMIGYTLAQAFNTGFEFLNAFVHELHWDSLGKFIAETLNGIFETIDWPLIYDTFVTGAKGLADMINAFTDWFNWDNISNTISNGLNTITATILTFFENVDWSALGHNFGYQISSSIEKIDWSQLGAALNAALQAIFDFLLAALSEIEWEEIGIAIRDFLIAIDWQGILQDVGDLISEVISGFIKVGYSALGGDVEELEKWQAENRRVRDEGLAEFDEWSSNMQKSAENFVKNFKEKISDPSQWDIVVLWNENAQFLINIWNSLKDRASEILESIKLFFSDAWDYIYENITEIWTGIQEWFSEYWILFTEFLTETWNNIVAFFTETWENIRLLFEAFIEFVQTVFIEIWKIVWDTAKNIFQTFRDVIKNIIDFIKEIFTLFFKAVKLLVDGDWKGAWDTAKKIFETFKEKVNGVIETVRGILDSFFEWVMEMVSGVLEAIGNIGSAISGAASSFGKFVGGIFGKGGLSGTPSPATAFYSTDFTSFAQDIPHLASGSVIRGGNPFIAMLGDQPHGQTNVEAPAGLIKDMVAQGIAESGIGNAYGNINADMTLDGESFARLFVPYVIDEMKRQGLAVEVLGVT